VTNAQWPVSIEKNHYQFSYQIVQRFGASPFTVEQLKEAVRIAGENVRNIVWTGWSMFHQFSRREIAPRIVIDIVAGEEVEALETDLRGETYIDTTLPDVWRITGDGRAVLIRPYREDRPPSENLRRRGLLPGTWLSPHTLTREVFEFATHAKELAKAFSLAERIDFRCSWYGLKGRKIDEFAPAYWSKAYISDTAERTTTKSVELEEISADTASVVVSLAAPVLRLFGLPAITRESVLNEVPRFRTL
jgi:hypothetical protein